jgi:hypothetical protein
LIALFHSTQAILQNFIALFHSNQPILQNYIALFHSTQAIYTCRYAFAFSMVKENRQRVAAFRSNRGTLPKNTHGMTDESGTLKRAGKRITGA